MYRYLELIEKAGNRAANLTSQLLAFSRKGKYEIKPIDINRSVRNVLSILGGTIKKNVEISSSMAKDIPRVEGDPAQLEQTIMNICVNAVDAMSDGGKLHLTTELVYLDKAFTTGHPGAKPGNYVHIAVTDTGIGMDKETLPKIFEPFFTTKDKHKGTGLGLSMVYGIVKNHSGYVDVHSESNKGTTFHIYLPPLLGDGSSMEEEKPVQEDIVTGKETILIVDDEEIIRTMLQEVLESLGYTVLMASKGEDALEIYRERRNEIDIVIIDMIMPKMGGKETYLELKKINPDVKTILATGYSQDAAIQEILHSGIHGFIHKPFTTTELSRKIREILGC